MLFFVGILFPAVLNYNSIKMRKHSIIMGITCFVVSCSQGIEKREGAAITIPFEKISSCEYDYACLRDWELSIIYFQSEESGIGRVAEIDKIREYNGDYYVLDRLQKVLIRYSSEGKPLNTIGQKGRGPEEYLSISDYSINMLGQVVILDGQLDEIIVYGNDGSFVSRQKMEHDYGELFHLDNGEILLALNAWDDSKLSGSKLVLADATFKPHAIISSFNQGYDINFVLPHIGFNDYSGIVSYVCPIDDNIYVFPREGGNNMSFLIDFGNEKVEDSQMINLEKSFPEIRRNKTLLLNATLIDDLIFIITVYEKGQWMDYYVDAKNKRKLALTPLGIRFLGGSGKSLYFEVTNPDLMYSSIHCSFDTVETSEKMVVSFSKKQ